MGGRQDANTGQILQSEVLIASATNKSDGMPIPLHCTWYNVTSKIHEATGKKSEEFIVIDQVTGACYQPSIDDVGDR